MDIQTDETQPQEILLITQLVTLLALIQAMDSIRQPIAAVGLMDTQRLGTLTMEDKQRQALVLGHIQQIHNLNKRARIGITYATRFRSP
jgi:hypothetical protein